LNNTHARQRPEAERFAGEGACVPGGCVPDWTASGSLANAGSSGVMWIRIFQDE